METAVAMRIDKSCPMLYRLREELADTDNFAIERGKVHRAIEWMNSYAIKNNKELEVQKEGYLLSTTQFGDFEVVSWKGEWSVARNMILKASKKLNIKVVEAGYHAKGQLLSSLFGVSREFAKVYSGGSIIGNLELGLKSGKWVVKGEKLT
jgi:hypothetical protein